MKNSLKSILKNIRLRLNKLGSKNRSKRLKIKNPTIISNNCYAGIVSQYLGIQYFTPTIGLYFFADEYIKFIKKIDYYIKQELCFIPAEKSKYAGELKKRNESDKIVGVLGDIEIVFLHYSTQREAKEKWERRVRRINPERIIFKFSEQNLCTEEHVNEFMRLPYKNKICFVAHDYDISGVIKIKSDFEKGENNSDYYKTHRYLNIIKYINSTERGER